MQNLGKLIFIYYLCTSLKADIDNFDINN